MSEFKIGKTDWNQDVSNPQRATPRKRDEFMRLQQGDNFLRIVTDPFQYYMHKWKVDGDGGFGDKVRCSKYHGECPLCDMRDVEGKQIYHPKTRWFVGVIDKKTGTYKVLDAGITMYKQIQKLSSGSWGPPTKYDINIIVDPKGGATDYYTVQPQPKEPLSEQMIDIVQGIDLEALKARCNAPTPDEVRRHMDNIRKKKGRPSKQEAEAAEAVAEVKSEADGEFDFPPAQVAS